MTDDFSPPLIQWTPQGLFCAAGGFHIDPHRAVEHAVVTHAHSDHARRGSEHYYCERSGLGLLRSRLGEKIRATGIPYGEVIHFGPVRVSFHSAGHILGSAQVRVEHLGEVWVASGDYKRDPDPSCAPFQSVPCDVFITEATFGTPKYAWQKDRDHGRDIVEWWQRVAAGDKNAVLFGYSLGKAQRILAELAPHARRPIYVHSAIAELNVHYRAEGIALAETRTIDEIAEGELLTGELILAPPSILRTKWASRLGEYETAFASGWMMGTKGSGAPSAQGGYRYDYGFVLSDHADWADLVRTIQETGAKRVFVQHREGALIRHLQRLGLEAFSAAELVERNFRGLPGSQLPLF